MKELSQETILIISSHITFIQMLQEIDTILHIKVLLRMFSSMLVQGLSESVILKPYTKLLSILEPLLMLMLQTINPFFMMWRFRWMTFQICRNTLSHSISDLLSFRHKIEDLIGLAVIGWLQQVLLRQSIFVLINGVIGLQLSLMFLGVVSRDIDSYLIIILMIPTNLSIYIMTICNSMIVVGISFMQVIRVKKRNSLLLLNTVKQIESLVLPDQTSIISCLQNNLNY